MKSSLLPESSLACSRAARIRRGINLSHWYSQVYSEAGYVPEHFASYNTEADIALIQAMGFDHVRFPIACEPILNAAHPEQLPDEYLKGIEGVIGLCLRHGLAVIVDIHPETPFKEQLAGNDEAVSAFVLFWKALATRLEAYAADRVFFEVLNEPCINNSKRWNAIQNRAIAAIRESAPDHSIIASGDQWSQLPELLKMDPPEDANVICNFHLYDPISITHQGAGWSPPWAMFTKGLSYPAEAASVTRYLERVEDPEARKQIAEYRDLGWNPDAYRKFIEPAVSWADRHGVPLTCNEFGVYKKFSLRQTRLDWVRDVSGVLEENRVGWTMWDYAGDFAVVKEEEGRRVPDRELLAALRLK